MFVSLSNVGTDLDEIWIVVEHSLEEHLLLFFFKPTWMGSRATASIK